MAAAAHSRYGSEWQCLKRQKSFYDDGDATKAKKQKAESEEESEDEEAESTEESDNQEGDEEEELEEEDGLGQRPDARPDAGPAADPRAKFPEESTPESIARVKLFAETDKAIIWAMDCGFPVWNTPGHGGGEPNRPSYNCWVNSLKESARINFYNGLVEDDFPNETLAQWFKSLPNYRIKVMRNFGEITKCNQGNAMEMISGISYTAFRNGRNLPATQSLVFPDDDSRDAWIKVWEGMKQLGLQYKFSDTARTTSASQPSQSSQSCNAGSCRRMGAVAPY